MNKREKHFVYKMKIDTMVKNKARKGEKEGLEGVTLSEIIRS